MTDQERIRLLREALGYYTGFLKKDDWGRRVAIDALERTAPEPVKQIWERYPELQRVGFGDSPSSWYLEGATITRFYAAAPLMAKALLAFVAARDTDDDEHEAEHAARAALKAAGVTE